jgi:acyl carrier protein
MTLDEAVKICPDLIKIDVSIMHEVANKISIPLDFNMTWDDMGYDDLDIVEFIMELEKRLDISIPDYVCDGLFGSTCKPIDMRKYTRDKKIDEILN